MIRYPISSFGSLVHRDDDASFSEALPLAAWRNDERALVANAKARSDEPGASLGATRIPTRAPQRASGLSRTHRTAMIAVAAWALTLLWPHDSYAEGGLRLPAAATTVAADRWAPIAARCGASADAERFARTELFFGLSRPGGVVTEAEFQSFVDGSVTPRFPDGLTLLSGNGQFRDSSGTIVVEGSKLLVLLYPRRDREAHRKIEQIRDDYKRLFQQQSVLRADEASCVSF